MKNVATGARISVVWRTGVGEGRHGVHELRATRQRVCVRSQHRLLALRKLLVTRLAEGLVGLVAEAAEPENGPLLGDLARALVVLVDLRHLPAVVDDERARRDAARV